MPEPTKRQTTKDGHHMLTVRLPMGDFEHLKNVQARRQKRAKGRKVGFNEIVIQCLRALR